MEKQNDKDSLDAYLKSLEERQRHQYDPGYDPGGRVSPRNAPRLFGWFWIAFVLMALVVGFLSFFSSSSRADALSNFLSQLPSYGLLILMLLAGLKLVKREPPKR